MSAPLVGLLALLSTSAAVADTITVATNVDAIDDNDECSLREAVREVNGEDPNDDCDPVAAAGPLTIFVPGGTYTLTLTSSEDDTAADGDLDFDSNVIVVLQGSTVTVAPTIIDGANIVRVFDLPGEGTDVTLRDLTVTHGFVDDEDGGGIRVASGNALSLERVTVTDNHVMNCTGTTGHGGGIALLSGLTAIESTISDNSAGDGQGGGDGCSGGGIYHHGGGALRLTNTDVTGNNAGAGSDGVAAGNGGLGGDGGGIHAEGDVTIEGGTISDNQAGSGGAGDGGAAAGGPGGDGGGIALRGSTTSLTVRGTEIIANTAGDTGSGVASEEGYGGYGGGVLVFSIGGSGPIDIVDAVISGNHAGDGGAASDTTEAHSGGDGGGVYLRLDNGPISIADTTLDGNTAGDGGAANDAGSGGDGGGGVLNAPEVSLERCSVTNNAAGNGADGIGDDAHAGVGGSGGGLYLEGPTSIGGCLIAFNVAGDGGNGTTGGDGGLGGGVLFGTATVTIVNTTISGNEAGTNGEEADFAGGLAGGVFAGGTLVLDHSTITANSAPVVGGGLWIGNNAAVEARNSVVSGNMAILGEDGEGLVFGHDCLTSGDGTLTSLGFLLLGDANDCELTVVPGNGDLLGVDPVLGPLADNGGPTSTHAPLSGSPVIDAGSCLDSQDQVVSTDQRGFPRPRGLTCDIGAFEASDGLLVTSEAEPAGDNCPGGGTRVDAGLDLDGDGALDADEVSSVLYLCDGSDAANGQDGADAPSVTYTAREIEVGDEQCPAGGVALDVGLDTDDDGMLGVEEVSDTVVLCNGEEGETGPAGQDGQDAPEGTGDAPPPSTPSTCSVTDNADGSATITCDDGTTARIVPIASEGCCATTGGTRPDPVVALALVLIILARRRRQRAGEVE